MDLYLFPMLSKTLKNVKMKQQQSYIGSCNSAPLLTVKPLGSKLVIDILLHSWLEEEKSKRRCFTYPRSLTEWVFHLDPAFWECL